MIGIERRLIPKVVLVILHARTMPPSCMNTISTWLIGLDSACVLDVWQVLYVGKGVANSVEKYDNDISGYQALLRMDDNKMTRQNKARLQYSHC